MTESDIREEVGIELELIEDVIRELAALRADVGERVPTVREKTAAAAFLAQFYGGVENVLKRISRFHSIPLPAGETWHVDLFKFFCEPPRKPLPILFDAILSGEMAAYRKFRHVVYHGYGFQLDWDRMQEGMAGIEDVYRRFQANVLAYLQ